MRAEEARWVRLMFDCRHTQEEELPMAYRYEHERVAGARLTEEARHQDQLRRDIFTAESAWRDATRFRRPMGGPGGANWVGTILLLVIAICYGVHSAFVWVQHLIINLF